MADRYSASVAYISDKGTPYFLLTVCNNEGRFDVRWEFELSEEEFLKLKIMMDIERDRQKTLSS